MATRSLIGVTGVKDNKEVIYIYCHWDGYPSHNGNVLLDHYQDEEKVLQLMALGDLSSLREKIGEKQDFNQPKDNCCVSFSRDRGEEDTEARVVASEAEFKSLDYGSEYKYLFKNGKWYFTNGKFGFVELTKSACQE